MWSSSPTLVTDHLIESNPTGRAFSRSQFGQELLELKGVQFVVVSPLRASVLENSYGYAQIL